MERLWLADARLKYPMKWIVAVNISWGEKNKLFGDIYLVTSDKHEAYNTAVELRKLGNMGKVSITEGFNDAPQIGGLELCNL